MVCEEIIGSKSDVWKYYKYDKTIQKAKCNQCEKPISAKGRSTGGLIKHLNGVHKIVVKDENSSTTTPTKRKMESLD